MGITIQQKGLAELYGKAAVLAGRAQRSRELEQRAIRKQEQIASIQAQQESQQIQIEQQRSMRMLDAQLDLERYERAKRWEIDKMEISSQTDFAREEQLRQRKLDGIDSAIQQIDKEVMAGRITEQEATPIKQRLEISKSGFSVPISALAGDEGDRYGVRPYYLEPEFERDYPELAEAKKKEVISGQRRGTVPYYLDPEWLRANRDIAMQVLESKGVMLEEDEIDALIRGIEEQVTVISPTGEEGTIPIEDLDEALAEGYRKVSETAPTELPLGNKQLDVGVQSKPVGVRERLEAGGAKFYKPSLSTFFTMSPLRALMERRKAKKIVR